jgi:hypothetical protein
VQSYQLSDEERGDRRPRHPRRAEGGGPGPLPQQGARSRGDISEGPRPALAQRGHIAIVGDPGAFQSTARGDLEDLRSTGRTVQLRVLGLATIADDVDAELALATISVVEVLGAFRAPRAVKAALASRTS